MVLWACWKLDSLHFCGCGTQPGVLGFIFLSQEPRTDNECPLSADQVLALTGWHPSFPTPPAHHPLNKVKRIDIRMMVREEPAKEEEVENIKKST